MLSCSGATRWRSTSAVLTYSWTVPAARKRLEGVQRRHPGLHRSAATTTLLTLKYDGKGAFVIHFMTSSTSSPRLARSTWSGEVEHRGRLGGGAGSRVGRSGLAAFMYLRGGAQIWRV